MLSKSEIRLRLIYISKYLKLSAFAAEFGLNQSTISRFMKSDVFDYMISTEKINEFYNYIVETLQIIT